MAEEKGKKMAKKTDKELKLEAQEKLRAKWRAKYRAKVKRKKQMEFVDIRPSNNVPSNNVLAGDLARESDDTVREAIVKLRSGMAVANDSFDHEWLLSFLEEKTKRMLEIARAKNHDYAGSAPDPFGNFSRVEALGVATTEQGFLVRMTDKMCRVASLLRPGITAQVKDESVEDTLLDLGNYALLLLAYREMKRLR